jgi:hypothetical protein
MAKRVGGRIVLSKGDWSLGKPRFFDAQGVELTEEQLRGPLRLEQAPIKAVVATKGQA